MGATSAMADQTCAWVWNRKLPTPITASTAQSARASGRPPVRRHITAAAITKAAFVTALTGSAQYPASSLSQ